MTSGAACAEFAAAHGVIPNGSAPQNSGVLLVPHKLPWPNDIGELTLFARLDELVKGSGLRVQAIVPAGEQVAVSLFAPPEPEAGEQRSEGPKGLAPLGEWRVSVGVAPTDEAFDDDAFRAATEVLAMRETGAASTSSTTVLLCTHGSRDRCCGSAGTTLYQSAITISVDPAVGGQSGYTLTRVSHLGGHRFAPTALVLPDATMWAFLTNDSLQAIATKSTSVASLLPHYRGSTLLPKGPAQVAEGAVFAEVGWDWLSWRRSAVVTKHDEDWLVHVSGRPSDEASGWRHWNVHVVVTREVAAPPCMSNDATQLNSVAGLTVPTEREYRVVAVREDPST